MKWSWSELVSTRESTVLIVSLPLGFPAHSEFFNGEGDENFGSDRKDMHIVFLSLVNEVWQTGGRADSLVPGFFFRVLTDRVTQVRVALTKPNGKGVEQFLEIPTPVVGSFQLRKESSKTRKNRSIFRTLSCLRDTCLRSKKFLQ
jgi:hypothetical protein